MSDINQVVVVGRLTRDPESKLLQANKILAVFSIACNYSSTKNGEKTKETSFFNCAAFGKIGETVSKLCHKGDRIGITGRLIQKIWQDKTGQKRQSVEIIVERIQFLNEKSEAGAAPPAADGGDQNSDDDFFAGW